MEITNEQLVEILALDSLHTAVQSWGIEMTEQKIKEVYKLQPTLMEYMLNVYSKKYLYHA